MHGIDSSASMIEAAQELCKDHKNSTFDGEVPNITVFVHD